MPRDSRTFRLFVSSTFSDLKAERNALQDHVFPRLKRLCLLNGCRFQDIDLRWGVSEEAGLDQRTMRICLQEVERCRRTTPKPNFLILLGDRYGWCPLPYEIPSTDFARIRQVTRPAALALLDEWYREDLNAVPPVFRLKPREREGPWADYDAWANGVERPLHALLRDAADRLSGGLAGDYTASATEHEIMAGALDGGAPDHVFGFFRSIPNLPASQAAAEFHDLDGAGAPIRTAADRLAALKQALQAALGHNVTPYTATWLDPGRWGVPPDTACADVLGQLQSAVERLPRAAQDQRTWDQLAARVAGAVAGLPPAPVESGAVPPPGASPITLDHLPRFCAEVYLRLARVILDAIASFGPADAVEAEQLAHHDFGEDRARDFEGRAREIEGMLAYVSGGPAAPYAIVGDAGSGKTALMAHAGELVAALPRFRGGHVITRYIGATPESADGRALLRSICREVARLYRQAEEDVPDDYRSLSHQLVERLGVTTADQPLALFIDAVDMLSPADRADRLGWLPRQLPPHVSLIVSTTPGGGLAAVRRRLDPAQVVPMGTLTDTEAERLLQRWLARAGRALTSLQSEAVVDGYRTAQSPLWLRLAFETAAEWTSDDPPRALPTTVDGIIAERFGLLSDEGNHGGRMVERSLGYLGAARHGLTEDELLDVLSRDAEVMDAFRTRSPKSPPVTRLPVVVWSRLFHDLEPYLGKLSADGTTVFTFYHQQVRQAAATAFLAGAAAARHAHLAAYFAHDERLVVEGAPGQRVFNLRKFAEQPYQQTEGRRWTDLAATLGELSFVQGKVEAGAGFDLAADYDRARAALPAPERFADDPLEAERAVLAVFGSAFSQELHAILSWPETTAQQVGNNIAAQTGTDGAPGAALDRWRRGPGPGRGHWLERINRGPRTAVSRALQRTIAAHNTPVTALAVSPDGAWLASAGQDGAIRVWDRGTGAEVASLPSAGPAVAGLAWMGADAERLRLASADVEGALTAWDWEGERAEGELGQTRSRVRGLVALPPDGLATAGDDCTVRVWLSGGRPPAPLRHRDRALCLAADRTGRVLVSGGADRTVRIWEWRNGAEPAVLREPEREVRAIALDREGTRAAAGDETGTIRTWQVRERRLHRVVPAHRQRVTCLGILSGAGLIVSGSSDTTVRLWDFDTGQPRRTHRAHTRGVTCLAVDPEEHWFATGGEDGTVRVWQADGERAAEPATEEHDAAVTALEPLPGRDLMASAGEDHTVRVWDAGGVHRKALRAHVGPVTCLAVAGGRLCSGGADRTIRVWPAEDGGIVDILGHHLAGVPRDALARSGLGAAQAGHARPVTVLCPVEPGRLLSAGEDGALLLWTVSPGRLERAFESVPGAIHRLLVRDGLVIGAGTPEELVLWRLTEDRIQTTLGGHDGRITALASAGPAVVSGGLDGTVRRWDLERRTHTVLAEHARAVYAVAADAAGELIASAGEDGVVRLTRPAARATVELPGTDGAVRVLHLDPEGGFVIAGTDAGRLFRWIPATGRLEATAHLGSAITALRPLGPDRVWVGTRSGAVALFQFHHQPARG